MSDPGTPYAWAGRFVAVADEQLAAAYDMGVQDSMLRATQYERILLDLLAELRGTVWDGYQARLVADRAEVRLLDDSPEVSPAATVQDDEKLSDAACGLCNTESTVTCMDCDRTFEMRASEERAFYRFHKCSPPERAILQDLINEASVAWGSDPDSVADALDRAEARLREVEEA